MQNEQYDWYFHWNRWSLPLIKRTLSNRPIWLRCTSLRLHFLLHLHGCFEQNTRSDWGQSRLPALRCVLFFSSSFSSKTFIVLTSPNWLTDIYLYGIFTCVLPLQQNAIVSLASAIQQRYSISQWHACGNRIIMRWAAT